MVGRCIHFCALVFHVTVFSTAYCMAESTDGTISLTCAFPFHSKLSAPRSARMEVPVQLQIPAVVLVVGLQTLAVKVIKCVNIMFEHVLKNVPSTAFAFDSGGRQ